MYKEVLNLFLIKFWKDCILFWYFLEYVLVFDGVVFSGISNMVVNNNSNFFIDYNSIYSGFV